MNAKVLCLLLVLPLFPPAVSAADGAYRITAPPGWVHDTRSMAKQNITGLFYKSGTRYKPGELHIYINPLPVPESEKLDTFIYNDILGFRRIYKNARYERDCLYRTARDYEIEVYRMDDEVTRYWQYIGYLKAGGMIYIFVLSARTPEERAENRKSWELLLDSFSLADSGARK
jgi:hypothetical protein